MKPESRGEQIFFSLQRLVCVEWGVGKIRVLVSLCTNFYSYVPWEQRGPDQ